MLFADLNYQRKNSTAWRLLTSPHAPLIASFFYQVFIQPNLRSLPFDVATSQLDDTLHYLNVGEHDRVFPRSAADYLNDWAGGTNAFLRKYYEKGNDIPQLDLTPGAEKAIEWLQSLQPRQFVGTESRLLTLYRLLQDIVHNTEQNPEVRIAELEKKKHKLDRQIARIKSGTIDSFDGTRVKERWFEAEDVARQLLSDFRQVEYNFRSLDQNVRELITLSDKKKGDLLDEIFDQQDYIHDSEQGKSFSAFWEFLMSPDRQQELENLTKTALQLEALNGLDNTQFMRYIGYALLDAGQKVFQTNAQLVEQLRRYLADQTWLENKYILEKIRGVEKSVLTLKQSGRRLPAHAFFSVDRPKADVCLLMEQRLFTPSTKTRFDSTHIEESNDDVDVSVLYEQQWVDVEQLKKGIRRLLQTRKQVSLSEVIQQYPLEQGLAELVAYLNIATGSNKTIINEKINEMLPLDGPAEEARDEPEDDADRESHSLLKIKKLRTTKKRVATIPQIIFTR